MVQKKLKKNYLKKKRFNKYLNLFLNQYFNYLTKFNFSNNLQKRSETQVTILSKNYFINKIIKKNINYFTIKGKKIQAYKHLISMFEHLHKETARNPYLVYFKAISNSSPAVGVQPIRKGRSVHKKPIFLKKQQQYFKGLKLLLKFKHQQKHWFIFLSNNILEASQKQGIILKQWKEYHQMIASNKMFVYLK